MKNNDKLIDLIGKDPELVHKYQEQESKYQEHTNKYQELQNKRDEIQEYQDRVVGANIGCLLVLLITLAIWLGAIYLFITM